MGLEEEIIGIVKEKLGMAEETISRETNLENNLKVDSLDAVEIIMDIEDR